MLIGNLIWHDSSVLPREDEDSVGTSEPVVVTSDGESIAAVAIYNFEVKRWYDIGAGEFHLIDEPLYWSYAKLDKSAADDVIVAKKKRDFPVGSRWRCPSMSLYSGKTQPGVIEITRRVGNNYWEYKIIEGMEGDKPPYKFDVYGMMADSLTPFSK